jgi:hypothetical protein
VDEGNRNLQQQVDSQRMAALPPSSPLPRPGLLSPAAQVVVLLLFAASGSGMVWLSQRSSEWQDKAEAAQMANGRLMQARCEEAVCGLQYDEHIVAYRDRSLLPTTVWGTAPIACKQAGHVPWVRPEHDCSGFEFMCLPADGLPIRGAE